MSYWLFKTEPDVFGIADLKKRPNQTEHWDGVRNYQARNFLRDEIKQGDKVFIYHSSCDNVGIAGVAEVVREGYVDPSQFDPESKYYDPKSSMDTPRWYMVDVKFIRQFKRVLSLKEIKANPALAEMPLVQKGNRLSVMPVKAAEWQVLLQMAGD
ncbi:EVE domain-containing protein [Aliiglaciecola sp. CAU 1673]|uniref:EVE domain-containing protein n=1 Tax=Aliiglaciecola sp. CAU 1673 TaxID=3032595 RepID=UPI0023DA9CA0|nr:EVE domain-containing protein [Aliiglaciecola sp. CAU 1673]MDF2179296.1 EVE domain-containing protein [Aliiglaciecola sp. CAU 1673]